MVFAAQKTWAILVIHQPERNGNIGQYLQQRALTLKNYTATQYNFIIITSIHYKTIISLVIFNVRTQHNYTKEISAGSALLARLRLLRVTVRRPERSVGRQQSGSGPLLEGCRQFMVRKTLPELRQTRPSFLELALPAQIFDSFKPLLGRQAGARSRRLCH